MDFNVLHRSILSIVLLVAIVCSVSCNKGGHIDIFIKNDTDDTLYLSSAKFQNIRYIPHSIMEIFSEYDENASRRDYFMSVINGYKYLSIFIDTTCVAYWQMQTSEFPRDSHNFFNPYSWDVQSEVIDNSMYSTFIINDGDLRQQQEE